MTIQGVVLPLTVVLLCSFSLNVASAQSTLEWWEQKLDSPYGGMHTGVKLFDINNDGYNDIFYSAGRHSVDQSYLRINLGLDEFGEHNFSDPIPIGDPGGFYMVDVAPLSSLSGGNVAVLLAGGTCGDSTCELRTEQPAVVLNVSVTGCNAFEPWLPCDSSYSTVWEDPNPAGDRNGAFENSLGDGIDPAVILVGKHGIKIFEPLNGGFPDSPTYHLTQAEKQAATNATIKRSSSVATGYIGGKPGLVAGVRTSSPPNPLVAVFKKLDGSYDWFSFAADNDQYGTQNGYTEATAVAMGDLNGDGMDDIVEASFLSPSFIEDGLNVSQNFFLWSEENSQQMDSSTSMTISKNKLFDAELPGYSISLGDIYSDSELPDIVHGMLDGSVKVFANLGVHNGVFSGFRTAATFNVPPECQIRDIAIGSLAPCTISIVTALYCLTNSGNYLFNADTDCPATSSPWPTWSPTVSSWPTMTPWPTLTKEPEQVDSVGTASPTTTPTETTASSPTAATSTNSPSLPTTPEPSTGDDLTESPSDVPSLVPSATLMVSDYPSLVPSAEPSLDATPSPENTTTDTVSPTQSPTRDVEGSVEIPSFAPDPFVESNENIDLDDLAPTQAKNSENGKNPWQFMALGLSIGMVIAGCIGIAKVVLLVRRRRKRKSSRNSAVISLYMEEDQLEELERR